MENPGTSLFQGSELLNLNQTNSEDEAEELEEEARRDAQLQELMAHGFDDLPSPTRNHDDESFASSEQHSADNTQHSNVQLEEDIVTQDSPVTRDSHPFTRPNGNKVLNGTMNGNTALSAHYDHCFHNGAGDVDSTSDQSVNFVRGRVNGAGDASEHVAGLYNVRLREIVRLQEQGAQREAEWSQRVETLEKKIIRLEAEKATAQTSCTKTQALLVSSKEHNAELVSELELLRKRNSYVEEQKSNLEKDLLLCRTTVDTLQAKITVLERGNIQRAGEAHTDALVKSLQERHRKEVNNLQNQLDSQTAKLETMDGALKEAEQRLWEATRRHENMLLERSEMVNRLSRALEESQRHCQDLVGAQQQQPSILTALSEKEQLEKKVSQLQTELEWAKADVDQLETLVGLGVLNNGDTEWLEKGKKKSEILHTIEGLRDELTRSLRNQEARRAEIKRLNQELQDREQEIMEMKQQEGKYKQVVTKLKEESDKLLQKQKFTQCDDESVNKLRQENLKYSQQIYELELQKKELQKKVAELEQLNNDLAEKSVEMQRAADEEKLRTIDAHSSEYLAFHQRAVTLARKQEREQAEAALSQLRLELDLERKSADEVKTAYVNIAQAKAAMQVELDELKNKIANQRQVSPPTQDRPDNTELRKQYEQMVVAEVEKAKQLLLREMEQERQSILEQAKTQSEKEIATRLAAAKAEWESNQTPTHLAGDDKLQEEILHLKQALVKQTEALKNERQLAEEQAWSHFREELQRVTENAIPSIRSQQCADRATSPMPSALFDASTSPLKQDRDLEKEVQILTSHLEETKTMHASRLADLQAHLQEKHREMEEFKKKVIEFTKMQVEAQEKDSMEYINALKKDIASLTIELNENKKISDEERTRLNSMIETLTAEINSIKSEKKNSDAKVASLRKKLTTLQEKHAQLKDYFDRRENHLRQEHKRREEKFFETLIKLKHAIDSLSRIEFPKFTNTTEHPTKDN